MGGSGDVCAIVLAAGLGERLRPLTSLVPKALCPVGLTPLLDRTLDRLKAAGLTGPEQVAVNAHWLADQVAAEVGERAHLSVEERPLGTAGAVGRLRDWIDRRDVLVLNADAYVAADKAGQPTDLSALLRGWDGATVRMHGVIGDHPHKFGRYDFAGTSLLPAAEAARLSDEPGELVGQVWRPAERDGRLEVIELDGAFIDCGTPARYLAANLHAASLKVAGRNPVNLNPATATGSVSGRGNLAAADAVITGTAEQSVLGAGSVVAGSVRRCVLWPGAVVGPDEVLVDVIRVGRELTVPGG